jgi:hypothetical protein
MATNLALTEYSSLTLSQQTFAPVNVAENALPVTSAPSQSSLSEAATAATSTQTPIALASAAASVPETTWYCDAEVASRVLALERKLEVKIFVFT